MIAGNPIEIVRAPTVVVEIYIAGSLTKALDVLAEEAANVGACWSVEAVDFVYTGGQESGCVIRSINYPRFPASADDIVKKAIALAHVLIVKLHQSSCCVVAPSETIWLSRRAK